MGLSKVNVLTADVLHICFFICIGDALGVVSIGDDMGQTNNLPQTCSNARRKRESGWQDERYREHLETYE